MSHIIGTVERIYDNRAYQGQPSNYPKYVIFVKDQNNVVLELLYYSKDNAPCKIGDKVSANYFPDKKGRPTVSQDKETKVHKFQVIPQNQAPIPTEEIPLDDDLSNHEPDHFANNGVVDNSGTNFDPNYLEKELTNPQTLKEQQIFCIAIVKSSIEGKFLEPTKDNIDKMILMLKDIYKRNFVK